MTEIGQLYKEFKFGRLSDEVYIVDNIGMHPSTGGQFVVYTRIRDGECFVIPQSQFEKEVESGEYTWKCDSYSEYNSPQYVTFTFTKVPVKVPRFQKIDL